MRTYPVEGNKDKEEIINTLKDFILHRVNMLNDMYMITIGNIDYIVGDKFIQIYRKTHIKPSHQLDITPEESKEILKKTMDTLNTTKYLVTEAEFLEYKELKESYGIDR